MSNKNLILLATIFLGLLAIAIVPRVFKEKNAQNKELKNVSVALSGYSAETTEKIIIKKGTDEKVFSVKDGEWSINDEKIDQTKMAAFFTDLKESKVRSLASKNEDNQKKFQVTPEDGTTLIIRQNSEDQEFYIGKSGASYGTFYIRKKGIQNVYLMESDLYAKISWTVAEWKETEEKTEEDNNETENSTPGKTL